MNVMFICTANSARSILAEAILGRLGAGRFKAWSAGSKPAESVNPDTIGLLNRLRHPTAGLRSKSWNEFNGPDAPIFSFVFVICDNRARELCPIWPGRPITARWGAPDPAAVTGTPDEIEQAFTRVYWLLHHRIELFVNLPVSSVGTLSVQRAGSRVGRSRPGAPFWSHPT